MFKEVSHGNSLQKHPVVSNDELFLHISPFVPQFCLHFGRLHSNEDNISVVFEDQRPDLNLASISPPPSVFA